MRRALDALRGLGTGLRSLSPRRRNALVAGVSALLVLAVATTLLVTVTRPGSQTQRIAIEPTSTDTATATSSPTLTPRPTATHTRSPGQPPVVVHAPPPPPVPTAPPNPTSNFCPTPTPLPAPTATATATSTATATAIATGSPAATARLGPLCQTCPYYAGNNPSQSQIRAALITAAATYHLPQNLLFAVAWQESKWHEDVTSCDGGIGLMQVQYYTYPWLNQQAIPACGLGATSYDPYNLQGNADLGAKYLAYLSCYYSYWGDEGDNSTSVSVGNPQPYTEAWYYQQAHAPYPDAGASGICAAVYNANTEYPDLPSAIASSVWDCPYNATASQPACTQNGSQPMLLEMTLSAYNEGPGNTNNGISNCWYVAGVVSKIVQFSSGALPVPS